MDNRIIKTFLICFFPSVFLISQPLKFQKERIEISVHDNYSTVTGTYYFENPGLNPVKNIIYYPFVINKLLQYPDSVYVYNLRTNSPVEFKTASKGIIFNAVVPPNSTSVYMVFYRQKTPGKEMEYILTSTRAWKNPLSDAEFLIKVSKNIRLEFLSYKEDKIEDSGGELTYFISRKNFMPEKNLVLKWQNKGE